MKRVRRMYLGARGDGAPRFYDWTQPPGLTRAERSAIALPRELDQVRQLLDHEPPPRLRQAVRQAIAAVRQAKLAKMREVAP